MNKDAILATIIGFGVGLVIAGLVFLGPTLFNGMPRFSMPDLSFITKLFNSKKDTAPSTDTSTTPKKFAIESPLPESIEPKEETLVSGTTAPNATVVIEGESSEIVVIANNDGAYAGKIPLTEGKNEISVTSYAKEKTETLTVTVYYTPESF